MSTAIACTLPAPEMRDRLAAIVGLAQRALLSHEQDGRTLRLRYASHVAEELEELVSRERVCCAFLDFELVRRPEAIHLIITAPAGAAEFAAVLTSHFLGKAAPKATGCGPSCCCPQAAA